MAGRFDKKSAIQPIGDVKDRYGTFKKYGCSAIIAVMDENLYFVPNNIGNNAKWDKDGNRGVINNTLKASYISSNGDENKIIPLASSRTVELKSL